MAILRYLGYAAFFLVSLIFGLYVTFPWDAAKDRMLDLAAKRSGMAITAKTITPSWLTGIVAEDVTITPAGAREPIALERLGVRAKVLSFITGKRGFTLDLPIAKGQLSADVVLDADTVEVKGETRDIELALIPGLVDAIGLPITGLTNIRTDLTIGMKDPKLTAGNIALKLKGLRIEKGGKITGFPVPELAIGDLEWQVPVEAGKATFKSLRLNGESLEMIIDGTIALLSPIARSNANLTVSFKPSDKFLQSEPLLGALLNNIQRAKGSDGFYTYQMSGSLGAPRFFPKHR